MVFVRVSSQHRSSRKSHAAFNLLRTSCVKVCIGTFRTHGFGETGDTVRDIDESFSAVGGRLGRRGYLFHGGALARLFHTFG